MTKPQKIIIISLLSFIAVLMTIAALLVVNDTNTRTIMIFMSGNNLESDGSIATSELNSIIPSKIDLNKNNVLLYTGGTKTWHNFVSSKENAIYKLTKSGFKKVKVYNKTGMDNEEPLTTFLKYGYENYKTKNYDLILWDHGLGSLGSISDEYSNGYLDLNEIDDALKSSPFNEKNKLETVIFRTCLNSTLEMASILYPYADYMVASEEVTLGSKLSSVLNFLNDIDNDSSYSYCKKFIDAYKAQMNTLNQFGESDSTYAITNLNKIPGLLVKLDSLFSNINVTNNYNGLSRIRANLHQYGVDSSNIYDYDTVDLYELVKELEKNDNKNAKAIEKYIKKEVVLYNWSTNNHSNGLAIYFPFNGNEKVIDLHLSLFNKVKVSNGYKKFITDFYNNQTSSSYKFAFNLSNNEVISEKENEFKLKLTDEQIKNYSKSSYMIFRKEDDGLFTPIYRGNDSVLDDNGYVTTKLSGNLIKIIDENDNSEGNVMLTQIESNKEYKEYTSLVILPKEGAGGVIIPAQRGNVHLRVDSENNIHEEVYLIEQDKDGNDKSSGSMTYLEDYDYVQFPQFRYKILDENGNYTKDWESGMKLTGKSYIFEVKKGKYHLETTSLDKYKGDYYCVFVIYDVQNKPNYSNLIKIN